MNSDYGTKLNYGKDVLYDFLKNEWVVWEIFLNKQAENEINIKKLARIQFEFLKCPIKNAA